MYLLVKRLVWIVIVVKTLHKNVRQQIKKRKTVYETKTNKEYKHVEFQPGDWVEYICAMRDF